MGKEDWYFVVGTILAILALLGMDWKLVSGRVSMHPSQTREILLLVAVVGSLVMSGIGWYTLSHTRRFNNIPPDKMELVYGKTFKQEKVELDGKRFQKCHFINVTFVFHGTATFVLEFNDIAGTPVVETDDPGADGVIKLFKAFGWFNPNVPIVIGRPNSPVPLKSD